MGQETVNSVNYDLWVNNKDIGNVLSYEFLTFEPDEKILDLFIKKDPQLVNIVKKVLSQKCLLPEVNEAKILHSSLHLRAYKIALLWVLKHQTKVRRTENPFNEPEVKAYELLGKYFNSLFDMCYELFEFLDEFNSGSALSYRDHFDLWGKVTEEAIAHNIYRYRRHGKETVINNMKDEYRKLHNFSNPYSEKLCHHYNLFAVAISVCQQQQGDNNKIKSRRKNFRTVYEKLCDNYRLWSRKIEDNDAFTTTYVDDGKLVSPTKRSKGSPAMKIIYPVPKKTKSLRARGGRS